MASYCYICHVQEPAVGKVIYTEMSQQSTGRQGGNLTAVLVARWSDAECKGWE